MKNDMKNDTRMKRLFQAKGILKFKGKEKKSRTEKCITCHGLRP